MAAQKRIPLLKRQDLQIFPVSYRNVEHYLVKDPIALRYWHLTAPQKTVLECLDGNSTYSDIRSVLEKKFAFEKHGLPQLQNVVIDLHRKALVLANTPGQGAILVDRDVKERLATFLRGTLNPLFIKMPGLSPGKVLDIAYRIFGRIACSRYMILLGLAFIGITAMAIQVCYSQVEKSFLSLGQFFSWKSLLLFWMLVGVTKLVHELGHAMALLRIGRECHSIGMAFILLSPTLYCDASDAWLEPNKWRRMAVGAAGIYADVVVAAIAFWWWFCLKDGVFQHVALYVFAISSASTVIFNANPLVKFDGYYILSDFLELPNLREKSDLEVKRTLAVIFGLTPWPLSESESNRPRLFLIIYGILSSTYRWVLLTSISAALILSFENRQLKSLGVALAVFSIVAAIAVAIRGLFSIKQLHDGMPVNRFRLGISSTFVLLMIIVIFWVPIPIRRVAPVFVESEKIYHVFAEQTAKLGSIDVDYGDLVDIGASIARLDDRVLFENTRDTVLDCQLLDVKLKVANLLGRHADYAMSQVQLGHEAKSLKQLLGQSEQLLIRAPCRGIVIKPAITRDRTIEQKREQLEEWTGCPLDRENVGALIKRGTHLFSVAPTNRFVAKIVLDQHDRDDLHLGDSVWLRFDHSIMVEVEGTVTAISDEQSEMVPRILSVKGGGHIPTSTDSLGRERLLSNAYLVTVSIDTENSPKLVNLLRGNAKFVVSDKTLSEWIHRWFVATFRSFW